MRPLILLGHSRAITHIKYNREGDLLFSAAKDHQPNVWFSLNGERLGTYNGHNGTVWSLDVDWTTKKLMTGSGDLTMKLWEVETGVELASIQSKSPVRATAFSYSGNMAAYTTDKAMRHNSELFIIDVRCVDSSSSYQDPIFRLPMLQSKITSMVWGPLDETVITGHENGMICAWDLKTGKELRSTNDHTGAINDMQLSKDGTMFITASKDTSAKLFDSDTLTCLKTYRTQKPVNSASISPIMEHVILGGGQDAMEVTTTSAESGKFETRFFHLIYEEEFARLKGHFGPINTLAFHPDGKSYTSGGEDGILRINYFDKSHLEYVFE